MFPKIGTARPTSPAFHAHRPAARRPRQDTALAEAHGAVGAAGRSAEEGEARTEHQASRASFSEGAAEQQLVEAWMKQSPQHEKVGAIVLKAWQDKSPQLLIADAHGITDLPPLPPQLQEIRLFRCPDLAELPSLAKREALQTLVIDDVGLKHPPDCARLPATESSASERDSRDDAAARPDRMRGPVGGAFFQLRHHFAHPMCRA